MIHEVAKPEISPVFTIHDIHKIREWHYEMLKDATVQERLDFYNKGSSAFPRYGVKQDDDPDICKRNG